jgi:hypothetical protein
MMSKKTFIPMRVGLADQRRQLGVGAQVGSIWVKSVIQ